MRFMVFTDPDYPACKNYLLMIYGDFSKVPFDKATYDSLCSFALGGAELHQKVAKVAGDSKAFSFDTRENLAIAVNMLLDLG